MHTFSSKIATFWLLTGLMMPSFAFAFQDSQGTVYDSAIQVLASSGIVQGYPDGSVRPFDYISRAEALKVILAAEPTSSAQVSSIRSRMPSLPLFNDINQQSWYAPYVETGFRMGVVKGYTDGTFRPADNVTAEEAIALMLRVYKKENPAAPYQTSQYIKNQPNQWYSSDISIAIQKNMIMHDLILQPGFPVTRGQLFDMLYRLRETHIKNIAAFPESSVRAIVAGGAVTPRARSLPPSSFEQYASQKNFAITLPTLGIMDLSIVHPDDPFTSKGILAVLDKGVGHLFSYPGEGGKIMVYGHSSGYPWDISEYTKIFRKINELNAGDRAYVTYNGKMYVYEVTKHATINVQDSSPFQPDKDGEELILYTCWPPDTVDERYLVFLKPVESVAVK